MPLWADRVRSFRLMRRLLAVTKRADMAAKAKQSSWASWKMTVMLWLRSSLTVASLQCFRSAENVAKGSEIHTDEHTGYQNLRFEDHYTHKTVTHSAKEYVGNEGQTTNSVEGFFMHLKRTISGTHIWVSRKHLSKYTGESEFIYNRRKCPQTMLPQLLSVFPAT